MLDNLVTDGPAALSGWRDIEVIHRQRANGSGEPDQLIVVYAKLMRQAAG